MFLNSGTRDGVSQVSENSSFRIASLTKILTSYISHVLINKNVIGLDTPLIEDYKEKYVDYERIYKITPHLILSHQTSFPNWAFDTPLRFEFDPGEKFQYSMKDS